MPSEMPELVLARMLNEFVYCPRLFFLEWVDRLFASSADVAEGERRHRRVDVSGGAAPLPGEGEVTAARSVELASERLGITGQHEILPTPSGHRLTLASTPVVSPTPGSPRTQVSGRFVP